MMLEGDKTSAPMQFARDPHRGFQVPHQWVNQTCSVQIDLVTTDEDTMKLSELAFTAATIMHLCVGRIGHANLGGIEMAGPWQTMKVILGGKKKVPSFLDLELNSTSQLGSQGNNSWEDQRPSELKNGQAEHGQSTDEIELQLES
ncbi:MAG: hypothetical protein LQ343_002973 [Gyalolechia ehrenbergii]|nr:MAG: hypothetical protein LQ343_002973 [Gyalolechia ehrenbergii]